MIAVTTVGSAKRSESEAAHVCVTIFIVTAEVKQQPVRSTILRDKPSIILVHSSCLF